MTRIQVLCAAVAVAAIASFSIQIGPAFAQPEVTEVNVESGDVLDAPPSDVRLCFSEPVNTQDQAEFVPENEGEVPWQFAYSLPDGTPLGLNIVFESDGDCVDVIAGLPEEPPDGVWTFEWMVRSQETNEEASDVIAFRVGPGDPPSADGDSTASGGGSDTTLFVIIGVVAAVAVSGVGAGAFIFRQRRGQRASG